MHAVAAEVDLAKHGVDPAGGEHACGASKHIEVVTLTVGLKQAYAVKTLPAAERIYLGNPHTFDRLPVDPLRGPGQAVPRRVAKKKHAHLAVTLAQGELVRPDVRLPGDILSENGKGAGNRLEAPDIGDAEGLREPFGGLAEVGADVEDHGPVIIEEDALEVAFKLESRPNIFSRVGLDTPKAKGTFYELAGLD